MKNGLSCDRLSACGFSANAFRLLVHTVAYAIVVLFREAVTAVPEGATATVRTPRQRVGEGGAGGGASGRAVGVGAAGTWARGGAVGSGAVGGASVRGAVAGGTRAGAGRGRGAARVRGAGRGKQPDGCRRKWCAPGAAQGPGSGRGEAG